MLCAQTMDNGRKRWSLLTLLEMSNLDTENLKKMKDYPQESRKNWQNHANLEKS